MSEITDFPAHFLDVTRRYDELRLQSVRRALGEAVVGQATEELRELQDVSHLGEAEIKAFLAEQAQRVDSARRFIEEQAAYDSRAAGIFTTVDGYELGTVNEGALTLWQRIEVGSQVLEAHLGQRQHTLAVTKQHEWLGASRIRRRTLDVTAEDITTLKSSVERLDLVNTLLA